MAWTRGLLGSRPGAADVHMYSVFVRGNTPFADTFRRRKREAVKNVQMYKEGRRADSNAKERDAVGVPVLATGMQSPLPPSLCVEAFAVVGGMTPGDSAGYPIPLLATVTVDSSSFLKGAEKPASAQTRYFAMLWRLQYINSHSLELSGHPNSQKTLKAQTSWKGGFVSQTLDSCLGAYGLGCVVASRMAPQSQIGVTLKPSSLCVVFTNQAAEHMGIYLSGNSIYVPAFIPCVYPSSAGGRKKIYKTGPIMTDRAFEPAGAQIGCAIMLNEKLMDERAYQQVFASMKNRSDRLCEEGAEYAAPAKWIAAYLDIFFEKDEDKELEGLAEALIKYGASAKPGSVVPLSEVLSSRRSLWQKIRCQPADNAREGAAEKAGQKAEAKRSYLGVLADAGGFRDTLPASPRFPRQSCTVNVDE
ncbi:hypothetical protein DFH11DRAFT_1549588 [Phellopilus nigrolimitatus]|nr:hypothetical protein DFH11DRAFT_1549588 [Phellopilus nigrolimitatus]